ncbi:MAG: hypothetical protein ACR2MN_14555 [Acidimicrobiales bacterium]
MPRIRRSDCSGQGYTRRRRGRGFEYLDASGRRVEDPAVLDRIEGLVLPLAWQAVWICSVSFGHPSTQGAVEEAVLDLLDPAGHTADKLSA